MIRALCLILIVSVVLPAGAAAELSENDQQRLADSTTDGDGLLDQQDGFYVLLRNASDWMGDDFGGDGAAALAPPPNYDALRQEPAEARGEVFLIEGWLVQQDRFPTKDNYDSDKLMRAGDPDWGDQVTRWTIATAKGDSTSTVIVFFNDPNAKMPKPAAGTQVKIAARFLKLWTIDDVDGKAFTYPVFVGGAAQMVSAGGLSAGGGPGRTAITIALVAVVGAFFGLRFLLNRMNPGGRRQTIAALEARRRAREQHEGEDDDEPIDDLPEDPIAALDVLRDRHEPD